jgi:hypothetical protein
MYFVNDSEYNNYAQYNNICIGKNVDVSGWEVTGKVVNVLRN